MKIKLKAVRIDQNHTDETYLLKIIINNDINKNSPLEISDIDISLINKNEQTMSWQSTHCAYKVYDLLQAKHYKPINNFFNRTDKTKIELIYHCYKDNISELLSILRKNKHITAKEFDKNIIRLSDLHHKFNNEHQHRIFSCF